MDEAMLAATSPHGNTPAEIYATIRDNALNDASEVCVKLSDSLLLNSAQKGACLVCAFQITSLRKERT